MTNHNKLLARLDAWLGTGDSDTADFLCDMRDAAALIRELASQLPEGMKHCTILFKKCSKGHGWLTATNWVQHECPTCQLETERKAREEAEREQDKWRRIRNPTHGPCCTCQACGLHYDDCRCDLDEVADRAEAAEAALAAIEAVLKECQRIPVMPFPDPGAHSWQAYGTAVFRAWSQIRQKIDIALKPTAAAQDNKARTSRDEFKAHSSVSLPNTPGPAPAAAHDEIARRWRNGS